MQARNLRRLKQIKHRVPRHPETHFGHDHDIQISAHPPNLQAPNSALFWMLFPRKHSEWSGLSPQSAAASRSSEFSSFLRTVEFGGGGADVVGLVVQPLWLGHRRMCLRWLSLKPNPLKNASTPCSNVIWLPEVPERFLDRHCHRTSSIWGTLPNFCFCPLPLLNGALTAYAEVWTQILGFGHRFCWSQLVQLRQCRKRGVDLHEVYNYRQALSWPQVWHGASQEMLSSSGWLYENRGCNPTKLVLRFALQQGDAFFWVVFCFTCELWWCFIEFVVDTLWSLLFSLACSHGGEWEREGDR